ncbi:MAG: hypothetical protein O7D86_11000 [Proteobacteria bacterium]|nr:hypothetical protein [Pseudomonadota bacterium]
MNKYLQITVYVLLSLVFLTGIPFLWLGLLPELTIIEYLSRWQVFGALLSTIAIYVGFMACIFGWNPQNNTLIWVRKHIILPSLSNIKSLITIILVLIVFEINAINFIVNFEQLYVENVTKLIFAENYDGADRELGSVDIKTEKIAELFFINDSVRQRFYYTTQSVDKNLCRIYVNYFNKQSVLFRTAYERYLLKYAHASCLQALENHKESLRLFNEALLLARWIGSDIERLTTRKIASVYFYDSHGASDIADKDQRLRHIISLISSDSNLTAQRMVGTSYFLLGEYAKAAETWNDAFKSISVDDIIEKKRMYNNISLAYSKINQDVLALDTIDRGIALPFDVTNEKERREQIRLLSNKSIVLLKVEDCIGAEETWSARNTLRQQELSKCTSILSAEIAACPVNVSDKDDVIKHLLLGVGQDPTTFKDYTQNALSSLVEQANVVFNECYLGLTFHSDKIKRILGI